jgi:hypothetical protein
MIRPGTAAALKNDEGGTLSIASPNNIEVDNPAIRLYSSFD